MWLLQVICWRVYGCSRLQDGDDTRLFCFVVTFYETILFTTFVHALVQF